MTAEDSPVNDAVDGTAEYWKVDRASVERAGDTAAKSVRDIATVKCAERGDFASFSEVPT